MSYTNYITTADLSVYHVSGWYYASDPAAHIRGAGRTASDALDDAAENLCAGTPPYAALAAYVDVPLDGPSEDEQGGPGGEPPPDATRPPCPCPACRLDTTLAQQAARAARIVAGYEAAPLLARQDMPGYYFSCFGVVYLRLDRWQRTIRHGLDWERAERLAARLNAMRCRGVAS